MLASLHTITKDQFCQCTWWWCKNIAFLAMAETCFCQASLERGLNWCWQKLTNHAMVQFCMMLN